LGEAGVVDGVSLRHALGDGAQVGAWAGAAPRITDLRPSGDSLSFGGYGSFSRALDDGATRVNIDGGFLGTTWAGAVDRKALALSTAIVGPKHWLYGHAVVEMGAPSRPSVEASQLFVDAGTTVGKKVQLRVRADQVRSVRTAEALALFPSGLYSTVAFSSARAGVQFRPRRGLTISSMTGWRVAAEGAGNLWSTVAVRTRGLLLADDRASLSADGAFGTYVDGGSGKLAYTLPIYRQIELRTGYRLYGYRYGTENERLYRHQPSIGLEGMLPGRVHASLDVDAYLGAERMMLATFLTVAKLL